MSDLYRTHLGHRVGPYAHKARPHHQTKPIINNSQHCPHLSIEVFILDVGLIQIIFSISIIKLGIEWSKFRMQVECQTLRDIDKSTCHERFWKCIFLLQGVSICRVSSQVMLFPIQEDMWQLWCFDKQKAIILNLHDFPFKSFLLFAKRHFLPQ